MTQEQIKRRLLFIIDDASRLLLHLESGKDMSEFTGFADDGYTHLSNIQIAADLEDTESDAWKDIQSMDGETMELVTRAFGMEEQMLRQLALQSDEDNLAALANEMNEIKNK
jgi:hypothetical protein